MRIRLNQQIRSYNDYANFRVLSYNVNLGSHCVDVATSGSRTSETGERANVCRIQLLETFSANYHFLVIFRKKSASHKKCHPAPKISDDLLHVLICHFPLWGPNP